MSQPAAPFDRAALESDLRTLLLYEAITEHPEVVVSHAFLVRLRRHFCATLQEVDRFQLGQTLELMKLPSKTQDEVACRLQKHRDQWREYAYGKTSKPDDYLDGNKVDHGLTLLEVTEQQIVQQQATIGLLKDALDEALEGWDYAANYKGEYLSKKHGDAEDIARLRKLLE